MRVEELLADDNIMESLKRAVKRYYRMVPDEKRGMVSEDDLWSAVYEAIVKASERYEPDRGAKFTTYAYQGINRALLDELIFYLGPEVLSYDGDIEGLADMAGCSAGTDGSSPATANGTEAAETGRVLKKMEQLGLTPMERQVCCLVHGIGQEKVKNLRRVGSMLHMTELQVRRLKQSAEEKIKKLSL